MTATFGKLAHQTLTLKPGLNIIEAPNEWGKSTWCAFLSAMLYGLDTRAKSTKSALADKERYQPWSGAPMAGRLEISWQGRDITIERRTKGRVPLGEFRAYESASGLAVPELTAANCGQMLLGVEKSVFLRSVFLRQWDLPVTGDENLRRRLQNLVTTGEEDPAGEQLAKQLKALKNRIRYHRTGLLPQLEEERGLLEEQLSQLSRLEAAIREQENRQRENRAWIQRLEQHGAYLAWQAALDDARLIRQAEQEWQAAESRLRALRERKPEKLSGKALLPGLLLILTGVLLGIFRDGAAGIAVAVLGASVMLWGLFRNKQKKNPPNEEKSLMEEAARARARWEALLSVAKPLPPEAEPVGLGRNAAETAGALREAREEETRLESRRSQYLGRMEALGTRKNLETQLASVNSRIEKLEKTYTALTMAQETLAEASAQLQRRFAPRIAGGAARRMQKMTNGRYDRVILNEDLSLLAGEAGEETLREALWRSDGTVDQLYLALRLSVSEALTPEAPLILDDALVRFDDTRLKAALELLEEEAQSRQVVIFTCQSREKRLLKRTESDPMLF